MSIGTNYMYQTWMQNIENASTNLFNLEGQISSGLAIQQPSDNPYGTSASLNMTSVQSSLTQYNSNLQTATTYLNFTQNALSSTNSLAQQAYSLAVEASNSTVDQTGLNAIETQVSAMQSQLIALANTQGPNGEYIFAGQKTNVQPFTLTGNTLTYNGDTNPINVASGPNQSIQMNVSGSGIFDTLYSQLEQFKSDLQSGSTGTISDVDIKNLQSMTSQITQVEGGVGATLQNISNLTSQNTQRISDLSTQISSYMDINYAETATQYESAQNAYQAALQVTANAQKMSLLNYI
jgi:flagellar hook-associated protein 3 FlgL